MIVITLVAIAISLSLSTIDIMFQWGLLLWVAIGGGFLAYIALLLADLIDDRRIDQRKLSSRFFNFVGLSTLALTFMIILPGFLVLSFQSLLFTLDRILG